MKMKALLFWNMLIILLVYYLHCLVVAVQCGNSCHSSHGDLSYHFLFYLDNFLLFQIVTSPHVTPVRQTQLPIVSICALLPCVFKYFAFLLVLCQSVLVCHVLSWGRSQRVHSSSPRSSEFFVLCKIMLIEISYCPEMNIPSFVPFTEEIFSSHRAILILL